MTLERRTGLGPGKKSLQRGSTFGKPRSRLKATPKERAPQARAAATKMTADERRATELFERVVKRGRTCAACGFHARNPRVELDVHHIVPKEILKRIERQTGAPKGSLVWDPVNGMALCSQMTENRCHPRHTVKFKPVPRSRIPEAALQFAERLGLMYLIERHYPDTQPPGEAPS